MGTGSSVQPKQGVLANPRVLYADQLSKQSKNKVCWVEGKCSFWGYNSPVFNSPSFLIGGEIIKTDFGPHYERKSFNLFL